MDPLQWMGAVRVKVQTADKNNTVIHTTPVLQLMPLAKSCVFVRNKSLIKMFLTYLLLRWFESYLTGRSFGVAWGGEVSTEHLLVTGVPQGSVLGPLLFSTYTTSLGPIIQAHGFSYHFYVDDTQLYLSFRPDDPTVAARISGCLADISAWMKEHHLQLNLAKTELLVFPATPTLQHDFTIQLGSSTITPSASVRNLGVIFDDQLTYSRSSAYFHSLLRIYIPSRSPSYFHSLLRIYIPSRSPSYFHSLLRIYIPSRSPSYFHSLLRIYIPSRSPSYFHSLLRIYIPSRSPSYFHSLLRIYIPSRSPAYFHSLLRIYIPPEAPPASTHYYESTSPPEAPPTATHY